MKPNWQPLGVAVALLVLLTVLLAGSRSPDLALREQLHEVLQDYELHDAELARDVLLSRAGLLPNYDALAADRRNLIATIETLRRVSNGGTAAAKLALAPRIDALADAQQAKLAAVEHFKSGNALLRNSLMYLTFAGPVLQVPMQQQALAAEIGRLSYAVLRYVQTPDADIEGEIQRVLGRLAAMPGAPPDLDTLVAHGRLIVLVLPHTDQLMREIIDAPTATLARELQGAVLEYSGRVEARAQLYRLAMYAVSLLLLAYLILQFMRLRAGARELRASDSRFRAITESAKEAIVTVDERGTVTAWNAGAAAMFGHPPAQIIGRPATALVPASRRERQGRALARLFSGDRTTLVTKTLEFPGLRADGSEFPLEASLSLWSTGEGRFVTGIMRDISERRRLEETTRQQEIELIQANKMTSLGTLVAGVAHEVNSPTQAVLMNAGTLLDSWPQIRQLLDLQAARQPDLQLGGLPYREMREVLPALTTDIRDAALRIQRYVDDLKDYSRPAAPGERSGFDLNATIERALRLLAHLIRSRTAHLGVALAPGLPPARGNAQHFEQVVVNLVVNALEALPDPSRGVTITTRLDAATGRPTMIVADEGIGIAREHLARLCDPFFTTRQANGGTGLGLAITANLLRTQGAELHFESEPGQGTRAIVQLAMAPIPAGTQQPAPA